MKCNAEVHAGFAVVFRNARRTLANMSLNRSEQRVFDYLQSHFEERQHWVGKVQNVCGRSSDAPTAVVRLELELWRYYEERSAVASPFKEAARVEGLKRTSMKNLAEHLMRLWIEPRPKKKTSDAPAPGDRGDFSR